MNSLTVWHFLRNDGTTGKGRIKVKVGETMRAKGKIVPCQNGLHGSVRAIDALRWAPGNMVQRARLSGVIVPHADGDQIDKYAAAERTCLAIADATTTLEYFTRWCALSVIDKWDASQIVLDFLMTGDEEIRAAAMNAARAAAAAWAASAAARDAAWAASLAARHAVSAAAWAASAAARDAAMNAVCDAARDADRDADRAVAMNAAWDAARDAARDAQNEELERLLNELMEEK